MNRLFLAGIIMVFTSSIYLWDYQAFVQNRSPNHQKFTDWIHKYNKQYLSDIEFIYRLGIYEKNFALIGQYNQDALGHAEFEENEYMDLDYSEFKLLKSTGHNHGSHQHKVSKGLLGQGSSKIKYLNLTNVPKSVDWRGIAVNDIQNQGSCGACWAFSVVGALEGAYALKTKNLLKFSEQQVIDCCRIDLYGCNGGDPILAFEECIMRDGIMQEHEYPFVGDQKGCFYDANRLAFKPQSYAIVPPNNSIQLKMAVSLSPISVCISSGPAFHFYKSGILNSKQCGDSYDHCVLIVGYGNDYLQRDYWIVKNSWGTKWGENGYLKIARSKSPGPGMCGISSEGSYVEFL